MSMKAAVAWARCHLFLQILSISFWLIAKTVALQHLSVAVTHSPINCVTSLHRQSLIFTPWPIISCGLRRSNRQASLIKWPLCGRSDQTLLFIQTLKTFSARQFPNFGTSEFVLAIDSAILN